MFVRPEHQHSTTAGTSLRYIFINNLHSFFICFYYSNMFFFSMIMIVVLILSWITSNYLAGGPDIDICIICSFILSDTVHGALKLDRSISDRTKPMSLPYNASAMDQLRCSLIRDELKWVSTGSLPYKASAMNQLRCSVRWFGVYSKGHSGGSE